MIRYRREIDGLRAVAVLPVILFHAGFGMFSGGFVGVDVFFVISGYLITSIILSEKQAGHFSLMRFYERRVRRILPPLFLVMLTCLPFAWWWMLPGELEKFSRSLVSVSMFTSNVLFGKQSGYFDSDAAMKPLLHTWSLAIEEQYYLGFPLCIMLMWKLGKRRILWVVAAVAAISLAIAEYTIRHEPAIAFYFLPARVWELMLGAMLAFFLLDRPNPHPRPVQQTGGLLGLALIAFAVLAFDESTPFPGLHALVPTVGAALIILCATPQTWAGKLLGSRPLVGIGLISYSAYLWHQPLFAFARIGTMEAPGKPLLVTLSLASLLLGYGSWKYVERPFRNPAWISRRAVFRATLAMSIFFIALGTYGRLNKGFEPYFITHRLSAQEQAAYALIKHHTGGDMYLDMGDDKACNFWAKNIDGPFTARFEACVKEHGPALVVLGDSHAMNIYNALYRAKAAPFMVGVAQGACRPYDGSDYCHYEKFRNFLAAHKDDVETVIYHQSGAYLLRDYMGRTDSTETFAPGKKYSIAYDNIATTSAYLETLSQSAKVIWLGPFTEARFDFRNVRKAARDGFVIEDRTIAIFDDLDKQLAETLLEKHPPFSYLSLSGILHIDANFLQQGDCITYRDVDHLSICGEEIVGKKIRKPLLQRSKNG